jgi:cell division protein FtsB
MTTEEYEATIESLQQELKTMREERDSLKKKLEDLGGGDVDEEVRKYLEDKNKIDKENQERINSLKQGLK